jgi:hypothetical protein
MQRYTILFITANALHVSDGFPPIIRSLKLYTQPLLLPSLTYTRCCVYSFELLKMGEETAWNMYSTDSNKECCITLHLVGYTYEIQNKIQRNSFH